MTQPPPKKTDTPAVWPMIAEDVRAGKYETHPWWAEALAREMEKRNEFGIQKYGQPVLVDNGRDPLRDALDEALDLCVYTRQQYEQTPKGQMGCRHGDVSWRAARAAAAGRAPCTRARWRDTLRR